MQSERRHAIAVVLVMGLIALNAWTISELRRVTAELHAALAEVTANGDQDPDADSERDEAAPAASVQVLSPESGMIVAVVSRTVDEEELDNLTPGPDLDALCVTGSTPTCAQDIVLYAQGPSIGSDFPGRDPRLALGDNDGVPTGGGDCDPESIWSMGGVGGFALFRFPPWATGARELVVYELDAVSCDNISVLRNDAYEVYLLRGDLPAIRSAEDVRSSDSFVLLGGASATASFELPRFRR